MQWRVVAGGEADQPLRRKRGQSFIGDRLVAGGSGKMVKVTEQEPGSGKGKKADELLDPETVVLKMTESVPASGPAMPLNYQVPSYCFHREHRVRRGPYIGCEMNCPAMEIVGRCRHGPVKLPLRMKQFQVQRDGDSDLEFEGVKLGAMSSYYPESQAQNRLTEIGIYKTKAGTFVVVIVGRTILRDEIQLPGEYDRHEAYHCDTEAAVSNVLRQQDGKFLGNLAEPSI